MGQCLGGGLLSLSLSLSLSLVARTVWHAFGLNLKGFFTHFIVNFSYFIVVFSHLFTCKRHFFRALCFFEIFKCFVFGLFTLVIASRFRKDGGFCHFERSEKSKEFKIRFVYGYFANAQYDSKAKIQIFYSKFKFFIQNSKHFINSIHFINLIHFINPTHFITLSQISSHTQGFFIFLPQVFAQCKLIKNFLQGGHCV